MQKVVGSSPIIRSDGTPSRSRTYLQRALIGLAVIPVLAGTATLLLGSDAIPDAGRPGASVESELRFYGVWWIGAGIFLASLARDVERRGWELRVFCALLALGAAGRVIALADDGRPHATFLVLMGVEIVVAVVLVVWQARVARA